MQSQQILLSTRVLYYIFTYIFDFENSFLSLDVAGTFSKIGIMSIPRHYLIHILRKCIISCEAKNEMILSCLKFFDGWRIPNLRMNGVKRLDGVWLLVKNKLRRRLRSRNANRKKLQQENGK